jgi:hypothetical protein
MVLFMARRQPGAGAKGGRALLRGANGPGRSVDGNALAEAYVLKTQWLRARARSIL